MAAEALRLDPASPWARASGSGSAAAVLVKAEAGVADGPALEGKPRAHDGGGRRGDAVPEAPGTLPGAKRDAVRGMGEDVKDATDDAAEGLVEAVSTMTMTKYSSGEDVWTRAVRVPCSERYMCSEVGHAK